MKKATQILLLLTAVTGLNAFAATECQKQNNSNHVQKPKEQRSQEAKAVVFGSTEQTQKKAADPKSNR